MGEPIVQGVSPVLRSASTVARIVGRYARQADTLLVRTAASNARTSVAQHQLARLEEARVLGHLTELRRRGGPLARAE